jgi:hypothetical protein
MVLPTKPKERIMATTRIKCSNKTCRKNATHIIRNAWQSSANGKPVCSANFCFTTLTGGYPAEGRLIK